MQIFELLEEADTQRQSMCALGDRPKQIRSPQLGFKPRIGLLQDNNVTVPPCSLLNSLLVMGSLLPSSLVLTVLI